MLNPLVLSTQAFPVGDGAEDAGAKQPVALRLKSPVVNGFRLGDFPMRPASDLFRRGETDPDGIEVGDQICSIVRRGSVHNFSYKFGVGDWGFGVGTPEC